VGSRENLESGAKRKDVNQQEKKIRGCGMATAGSIFVDCGKWGSEENSKTQAKTNKEPERGAGRGKKKAEPRASDGTHYQ